MYDLKFCQYLKKAILFLINLNKNNYLCILKEKKVAEAFERVEVTQATFLLYIDI